MAHNSFACGASPPPPFLFASLDIQVKSRIIEIKNGDQSFKANVHCVDWPKGNEIEKLYKCTQFCILDDDKQERHESLIDSIKLEDDKVNKEFEPEVLKYLEDGKVIDNEKYQDVKKRAQAELNRRIKKIRQKITDFRKRECNTLKVPLEVKSPTGSKIARFTKSKIAGDNSIIITDLISKKVLRLERHSIFQQEDWSRISQASLFKDLLNYEKFIKSGEKEKVLLMGLSKDFYNPKIQDSRGQGTTKTKRVNSLEGNWCSGGCNVGCNQNNKTEPAKLRDRQRGNPI